MRLNMSPNRVIRAIKLRYFKYFGKYKNLADLYYYLIFGKKINWDKPEDLNQWINWLAFNTDTTKWSILADKLAVRNYVEQAGLGNLLIPLVDSWDKPNDLDFEKLPDDIVLKMSNGSGDVRIIRKKKRYKYK